MVLRVCSQARLPKMAKVERKGFLPEAASPAAVPIMSPSETPIWKKRWGNFSPKSRGWGDGPGTGMGGGRRRRLGTGRRWEGGRARELGSAEEVRVLLAELFSGQVE